MIKFYVLIIILLSLPLSIFLQAQDFQFNHITTEDGLSNNSIFSILQDSQGFIWFGTSDGLNRWDGYTFKIFTPNSDDSNSISHKFVHSLLEDSSGRIWIGTNGGLNIYDPQTENFKRYLHNERDSASISHNCVKTIFGDHAGNIWLGTPKGLNRYNPKNDNFTRYFFPGQWDSVSFWWNNNTIQAIHETFDGKLILGTTNDFLIFEPETKVTKIIPYALPERERWPTINSIYRDRLGKFWIAMAGDGIVEYDPETEKARLYRPEPNNPYSFGDRRSTSAYEDKSGRLWIGTPNNGLDIFDRTTRRFRHIKPGGNQENCLKGSDIQCIYQDKHENIWIGMSDAGLNLVSKWKKPFRHYIHDTQNSNSLAQGEVTYFYEENDSILWIGYYLSGISLLNRNSGNFTHFIHDPQNSASLSRGSVMNICEDQSGYIWLASSPFLDRLDRKTGIFKHYQYDPSNPKSHAYVISLCCYEDRQGTLWFGLTNAGLERFNRTDETFDRFCHDPADSNSISSNRVQILYEDKSGNFWIGTDDGLCQLVHDTSGKEKFIRYQPNPLRRESIAGKNVTAIYEDRNNRLWIGTEAGLNLFDRDRKCFKVITEKDGLPGNSIMGIVEDDYGLDDGKAGNLWLRTTRGIVKFNPESRTIRIYDERDGLKYCKTILEGYAAFYKGKKGEIYSGGANSMAVFHPDSLKDNPDPPKIVLTDFKINYESVKIGSDSPLKKSITFTPEIKLSYYQNIISFEFAALDFTSPKKNLYAYKLEGINADWVYTDASRRFATYTNLQPGKYIFYVKGSNNDGVWNETGTSIQIVITPPWWRTYLAYVIYIFIIVSLVLAARKYELQRTRLRGELKMRRFESQKLQEIDTMKSRFFANISHEFRTPLTLILGPISKMLEKTKDAETRLELTMMQRNAKRLQRLINQLLDLSKIEAGKMTLQTRPENIVTLLNRIVQSFESQAKLKEIELKFHSEQHEIIVYVDQEKIENIFYNLISNALKFTASGGIVECNVQIGNDQTSEIRNPQSEIVIKDSGIGIPPDRLDKIFDRFYQVDDSRTREHEGTGIGLALTKELVELHHGRIEVASELQKGTTFTVYIPLGKEHLKPEEIVSDQSDQSSEIRNPKSEIVMNAPTVIEILPETEGFTSEPHPPQKTLPILLLVEDNRDIRAYMRDCLCRQYQLVEAIDGEDGFHQAVNYIPDLIISDVMMPKIDGYELCQNLKSDERTSHIPVILLTAKASMSSKIKGLEFGADDYLIKPFDPKELQVRVKNLIESRRKLREKFSQNIFLKPAEIAVTSYDQRFLQRTIDIIEKHLIDPDFDVTLLTHEVGLSRMQLHRKLHALINQSANQFIRSLRLKRAAELLRQHYGNVSEIAYEVGFSNPSYFAECFRRQFGVVPSEYQESR